MKTKIIVIFITLIVVFSFSSCKKTEADPEFVNSSITGTYKGKVVKGYDNYSATATIIKTDSKTFALNLKVTSGYGSLYDSDVTFNGVTMTSANAFNINNLNANGKGDISSYSHKGIGSVDDKNLTFTTNFFTTYTNNMTFTGTKQ
jgi:hypothetical protein